MKMMQEDRYNDFDLQIRSMLQDAEEEVPSRVWDAVSSRIERGKVTGLWWRRAAAGAAVAAAVALGVFFALRPSSGSVTDGPVLAEVQPAAENAGTTESVETLLAEGSIDRPAAVRKAVGTENAIPAESAAPSEEQSTEAEGSGTAAPAGSGKTAGQNEEYRDDPFARMAAEDSRRDAWRERVSGFVQGNVTSNERSSKASGRMASSSNGTAAKTGVTENSISTYGIPLSFGVGARYRFSEKWSASAALTYTLLSRSFTGTYSDGTSKSDVADINNNIHYLGIPVNVYYDILQSNKVSFYAFGGFSVEKGLVNKYNIHSQRPIHYSESVPGLQWSSALGLGFEFLLNDYLALYVDPSARYYFDCNQPKSVRTQKPFMMNLEVGLRFNI